MVYFKSSFKKLISIYVSLFLIFSHLSGQTKQESQIISQKEYEKKEKWNIQFTEGDSYLNVALWDYKEDSLAVTELEKTRTIDIGSIVRISATKEKYTGGKGGFIAGALIGVALVFLFVSKCESSTGIEGNCVPIGFLSVGIGALFQNDLKKREVYDMSGWSIEEKKAKIQEIMNSE